MGDRATAIPDATEARARPDLPDIISRHAALDGLVRPMRIYPVGWSAWGWKARTAFQWDTVHEAKTERTASPAATSLARHHKETS